MATPTPEISCGFLDHPANSTATSAAAEEQLRQLAAIDTQYRQLLVSINESQLDAAQSLTYFKIADATRRTAHVAMVRAAGAVSTTQAHRLAQNSLDQVFSLDLADIAAGTPLALNQLLPAEAKAHYRSEIDLIAQIGDLKPHAAKTLLKSHRQLVGTCQRPAQFPALAQRFTDPSTNPEVISQAAARIGALQLRGKALKRAESRVARSSAQGQSAVNAELKSLSDELSAPNLPERESVHERCAGLRYRGLGPRGHVWELTCTTIDHEFLSTLADRLVNPNLAANRQGSSFTVQPPATEPTGSEEDYNDPASVKARKLLHTVVEILRRNARTRRSSAATADSQDLTQDPQPLQLDQHGSANSLGDADAPSAPEEQSLEPAGTALPPMIDLIVTIDYDALFAKTTAAGLTSHGQRISATALRQSAAIAGIIPEVLGSCGEILDYGRRRRLFTAAQTRSVVGRDRGCVNPGCSMPAHRCEVNHCQPWHRGGKTCVNNGCLLCKNCHLAFHAGHFKLKMINGVPYVLQSAERDPEQLWRRNWVWHPQAEALAA